MSGIRFDNISVVQGLSQSSVHCILQDSKGFMWFGTWDGLNKYDGYRFEVFKNDPEDYDSLSHNSIQAIAEDHKGMLWIGTEGGGLNRFDPKTERAVRYRHKPDDPLSLSHDNITAVIEDRNGNIWIGTEGGGLNRFDRKTGQFIRFQHNPDNPHSLSHNTVRSIAEDRSGLLWVGTQDGLNRFEPETGKFIRYQHDSDNPGTLSHNNIRSICEDQMENLWIGTEKGVNCLKHKASGAKDGFVRYQHKTDDPDSLSNNIVSVVYEDREGMLWIGTEGGGLNRFDRTKEKFIRYQNDPDDPDSLPHDVIWTVYEDRTGILWIGTYTGGLSKYDRRREHFIHYKNDPDNPHSLSQNNVWALYESRDRLLWIGTDTGLNRFDRKKEEFTLFQSDPDNPRTLTHNEVWTIIQDQDEFLWVGTYNGLNRFDPETGVSVRYYIKEHTDKNANKIRIVYEDSIGRIWAGTGAGLYHFDPEKNRFVRSVHADIPCLTDNNIWAIYEDLSGFLWFGTEEGLWRFDRKTDGFVSFKNDPDDPGSLSDSWVLSVNEDQRGNLWVGTIGGLNRLEPGEKNFTRFREKDGLANDVVYGILEDRRGYLWLSTNKGLSRFDPVKEIFKNYDVRDGLQSNEFNVGAYHRNRNGEMFFGGINGFNLFYPSERTNPYGPMIVITDFRIFNEPVIPGDNSPLEKSIEYAEKIRLSYKDRVFSFEFVALHFASPEKNQYAYMMKGFDQDWIYSGTRRFATYTNLSAGQYVFRVKGSNNDGIWNEKGASIIAITITPPPWKTWWAYMLYMFTGVGGVIGYVRYKTKLHAEEIERQRKELEQKRQLAELLEKKVKERTSELNRTLEDVKEANRKITDSIHYSQMIQRSLLPNPEEVKSFLPESFFLWMPRDIVGGDIFFVDLFSNGFVLAVIDCTGHGVPGAFMTMIASSGLKRIIKDEGCHDPARILKRLNFIVKTTLQQDTEYALSDDGLDAGICVVRLKETYMTAIDLTFAGARLPLFYTLNNKITMIKGDRQSIGYKRSDINFEFTNYVVDIKNGMCFYMATDGFQDQLRKDETSHFNFRSFGKRRLKELLRKNSHLPFDEQKKELVRTFEEHRGDMERQDDVTVVGFGFRKDADSS